jgi:hypothetical protein
MLSPQVETSRALKPWSHTEPRNELGIEIIGEIIGELSSAAQSNGGADVV